LRGELGLTHLLYEVNYGRQIPYELRLKNLRLIYDSRRCSEERRVTTDLATDAASPIRLEE
jgi:hypothetical protein